MGKRSRRWIAAAAILAVAATFFLFLFVRWRNPQPYFGDEPHYLLMSRSLVLDGDVDVRNDYLAGRYLRYYPYPTNAHVNTTIFTADSPHWYSVHGVGLPALLAPAVRADDADGATVAMVVIATGVAVLTFLWARRFVSNIWVAGVATAALVLSPAFLGLQSRIFPDLPTAALLLGCMLLLESSRRRLWQPALLGSLIGISPWFHFKNGIAFATIGAIAFVLIARDSRGRERVTKLACLAVPAAIGALGYEVAIHAWYGSWLPMRMFGPGNEAFKISPAVGLEAASFDGARGLFTNNPALILVFVGLPLWARWFLGALGRVTLVLVPTIWIQSTFVDWSGGNAPPARYAMQFAPLLVPAIAILLQKSPVWLRASASAIIAFGWAVAAAFVWLSPAWGYVGDRSPLFGLIDRRLGPALDRVTPTYDVRAKLLKGGFALTCWIALAALLVLVGAFAASRPARRAVDAT